MEVIAATTTATVITTGELSHKKGEEPDVPLLRVKLKTGKAPRVTSFPNFANDNYCLNVVHAAHFVEEKAIKFVNIASFACLSGCAQSVSDALVGAPSPLVGARLHQFWVVWDQMGASPRAVKLLKEGFVLPFNIRPPLTRTPLIKSGYAHAIR